MPKFRSITLSVVSQWELRLHPEYPHPHSEKFRIFNSVQSLNEQSEVKEGSENEEDDVQEYSYLGNGRSARVSVYIPSCPGTRFWIRYTISPDHPPAKLFYFKLFLNGRHITSWGTNPQSRPRGQIMRALFNPEPEQNDRFRPTGIQSRPFFFAPETENEAAVDGGLIEVKCFRAKGRRLRAAAPEDFRGGQEVYGLNLPKGGLLDCPEDARFYDWLLVDPKDSPYATFRFHYRSWENLVALSIIPPQLPRPLLTRSSSMWSATQEDPRNGSEDEQKSAEDREELESHEESTLEPGMSDYFANGQIMDSAKSRPLPTPGNQSDLSRDVYSADRPPTPFEISSYSSGKDTPTERMLPTPPPRSHPELHRASSQASTARSITASLYDYLDRETNDQSPEPFLGVAAAVPVLNTSTIYDDSYLEGYSQLSVESPQRQNMFPSSYGIERPPEAMFSPETVAALRQNKGDIDFVPNIHPTRIPMATFYSDRFKVQTDHERAPELPSDERGTFRAEWDSDLEETETEEQEDLTIGLAESDCHLRTPSPAKRNPEHIEVEDVWNTSNDAVEDVVIPYQAALEYGQSRDRTSLLPPVPEPRLNARQRIRTWI